MKQTIQGVILGAVVAAGVSVLLAQTPNWTAPRTWATDNLLTAGEFNQQFRDNLLWLREDATLTGTAALDDLGCGTRGSGEVLYSNCDWAALPAGVVFDIHDDVTTAETIVDLDRVAFSDESANGDPMRFTTAANLADYMQVEVELDASRVTGGSFNTARIPNLPASKITSGPFHTALIPDLPAGQITSGTFSVDRITNLPASKTNSGTFELARIPDIPIGGLDFSGTCDATTFLRGDGECAEPPAQYAANLQAGPITTTSTTYVDAGGPATLLVSGSGHEVAIHLTGMLRKPSYVSTGCRIRILNTATMTVLSVSSTLSESDPYNDVYLDHMVVDMNPMVGLNPYQIQIRSRSVQNSCVWTNIGAFDNNAFGSRGLVAFLS